MYRNIPVSVKNIDVLRGFGHIILPQGNCLLQLSSTVDETDRANFVVVTINNPQFTEIQLWVRPFYQNYRDAWEKTFGIQSLIGNMDVDHIHARERANDVGYEYIRLALVSTSSNRSAGAGYEKKLLKAYRTVQFEPHAIPNIRYLDYVQAVKVRGVNIGSARQGYPGFFQTHDGFIPPGILGSKKDRHGQELPWELV